MALEIIDKKIVGAINKLEDKLNGKLPIDRLELLYKEAIAEILSIDEEENLNNDFSM